MHNTFWVKKPFLARKNDWNYILKKKKKKKNVQ